MYQIKKDDSYQIEEEVLFNEVSDEALERTVEMCGTRAFTLGNCTGLGSCPA
jgi:hypothetical protein